MLAYRTIGWWYWLAAMVLLALGVNGHELAWLLLIELMCAQIIHSAALTRSLVSLPVQVRVAYLELLLLGLWEPLQIVHWGLLAGTTSMVLFGYSPPARALSLLPWNRREPLTTELLWRTIIQPPRADEVDLGLGERHRRTPDAAAFTGETTRWKQPEPKTHHS